ncbi:MAG: hypothetical protein U0Q21_08955 [Dermatophilaceae bacterium]
MTRKSVKILAAMAATGALSAGLMTSASAGGDNNMSNAKPSYVDEGRAPTPPPRVFAVVNSDGSFMRGKGVISTTRLSTGVYDVRFVRNITTCNWLGTVGQGNFVGSTGPGIITITGRNGTNNGLFVTTFTAGGAAADLPFAADVICS